MKIKVENNLSTIVETNPSELEWIKFYLSIAIPQFRKNYQTGKIERDIQRTSFVKRNRTFPTGFIYLIRKGAKQENPPIKLSFIDERKKASKDPVDVDLSHLRYYQTEAVEIVVKKKRGIIWHPTGSGKTIVAVALTQRIPIDWLFLVQSTDLMYQTADKYKEFAGKEASIIGDGVVEFSSNGNLTVAMAQTLHARRDDDDLWEFVRNVEGLMVDECFPAGTLIDKKPIESIKVGDLITSFDEKSCKFVKRKVTKVFKSKPKALVQVTLVTGTQIVCTPGHPFLTANGWKKAIDLSGEFVLHTDYHDNKSDVQLLPKTFHSKLFPDKPHKAGEVKSILHQKMLPKVCEDKRKTLLRGMFETVFEKKGRSFLLEEVPKSLERQTSNRDKKVCIKSTFRKDDKKQPHTHTRNKRENDGFPTHKGKLETSNTRREWQRPNNPGNCPSNSSRMGVECYSPYSKEKRNRISNKLQDRHRKQRIKNRCRSGRELSQSIGSKSVRPEKGKATTWTRVDNIKILQQTSDGKFNGLCPDGYVYNLEVEGTHTYIANNCVVHNCHTLAAETIYRVAVSTKNASYKIGLSGTPLDRTDKKGMLTIGATGPILHRVTSRELIDAGYLSEPHIEMHECEQHSNKPTYAGAYGELVTRSAKRNKLLSELMINAATPNLTFVKQIRHGRLLLDRAEKAGLSIEFVWGNVKPKQRKAAIERLVRGDIDYIICSVIFVQGIDIPELRSLVIGAGGKSIIQTLQRLGRGMRVTEDKNKFEVYDVKDSGNKWMRNHSSTRKRSYEREGHEVHIIGESEKD